MKKLPSLFGLLFACVFSFALQLNAQSTFQKAIGGSQTEFAYSIKPTYDSGYVMLGSTMSFMGGFYDIMLIKLDQYCNVQWTRVYGDGQLSGNNIGYEVIQITDSGFVIAAHANPPGDGMIIRTDKLGNVVWTRTTAESGMEALHSVVQTQDGKIVATGKAQHGLNNDDLLLVKMDTSGNLIWKKSYGGTGYDVGYRIIELPNTDLVMTGYTSTYGAGWMDAYVIKTDSAGNAIWTKTYGTPEDEEGHDIKHTTDGGFIISGQLYSNTTGMEIYLVKIDSAGTLQWSKTYGGVDGDFGHDVIESPNGGYVVACSTFTYPRGAMLLRVDNGGNHIWTNTYGDPTGLNDFHALLPVGENDYMMTGMTYVYPNDVHMYLVRTDSSGYSGCMQQPLFPVVANPATQTGSGGTFTVNSSWNTFSVADTIVTPQVITYCIAMDINDATEESTVRLFPNPVTDYSFTIADGSGDAMLTVFNAFGQIVHAQKVVTYPVTVNLPATLPAGMYVVEISGGEEIVRERLVIE